MSIYPKNISKGENLIIHLRFSNKGKKNEIVKYKLYVQDPEGTNILKKEKNIYLGVDDDEFVRQIYYSIHITDKFKPGKYLVKFYLICRGNIIESLTKDTDFFYVEDIKYFNLKGKTYIYNKSPENVNIELYDNNNISKTFNIKGNSTLEIPNSYKYIKYANNKFDIIKEKKKIYIKNPLIKFNNNKLIDTKYGKEIKLTKEEITEFKLLDDIFYDSKYISKFLEKSIILEKTTNTFI